jgi:hypothetical protein
MVAMALTASCASGMGKPHVTATVDDTSLKLAPASAGEGKVKFDIDNTATSNRMLLILRSKDVSQVPVTPDGMIDMSKASIADTVLEFGPGRFRTQTPNLVGGSYVVVTTTPGPAGPDGKLRYPFSPSQAATLSVRSAR